MANASRSGQHTGAINVKRFRKRWLAAYRRRHVPWWKRISSEASGTTPSVHAWALHRQSQSEAIARAERLLGTADEWPSLLMKYRWTSDFQADWKAEIGHWLHTAEESGYLANAVERPLSRRKGGNRKEVHPNDSTHLVLQHELAPSKIAHYLIRTRWAFRAWEPITGGPVDVDLRLASPDGTEVEIQVKAPDQPGVVTNHRLHDGEFDDRVISALDKAARKLPADEMRPTLIGVTALRRWPLSTNCRCVVVHVVGSSVQEVGGRVSVPASRAGMFFKPEWSHVSGVMLLDYVRSDAFRYACTVFVNPNAKRQISPAWFPHARVCVLSDGAFRWIRGTPSNHCTLPDGTPFDASG